MTNEFLHMTVMIFFVSLIISGLLVLGSRVAPKYFVRPQDLKAKQAAHEKPTSRLGGIAVLCGAAVMFLFALPPGFDPALKLLFLSVLPVLIAGLAEDCGLHVSPRVRLAAAAAASLLAAALLGHWVTRADIPLVDLALAIPVIGLLVTAIGGAGVSHSFNLIDGVNGLSSGVAALAAIGLAAIAHKAGEPEISLVALLLVAAILGFMVFNWPMGAVFLGDAGAYSLGHILGWLGILLVARVPETSMLAITGLFFWPLADTFFAIYRRRRAGRPTDQPDRLHFHQLIMRGLEICFVGRENRQIANPLTTALLLPIIAVGVLGHVLLWDNPLAATALWAVQGTGFVLLYLIGIRAVNVRRKAKWQRPENHHHPLHEH